MSQFGFNTEFNELYSRDGLVKLDAAFIAALQAADVGLHNRLLALRADISSVSGKEQSQFLIELAPHVEYFIGKLFGVEKELRALAEQHHLLAPLYACKRLFVQRRAAKALTPEAAAHVNGDMLLAMLPVPPAEDAHFELAFAKIIMGWLEKEAEHASLLEIAARYAAWALHSHDGQKKHAQGLLFKQPKKLDPQHLVPVESELRDGVTVMRLPTHHLRQRDGFKLTDPGGTLAQALDQAHYCIFCHNQGKDSCAKGMREKGIGDSGFGIRENNPIPNPHPPIPPFKQNALGITLNGCPLEEKISEMNMLQASGVPLGALAMVVIDNPMCAGTGHRICNDCMKSCIYQKQEPVNIPLVETRTLDDVLSLPYGFEIYSLLTRWNPLNLERPLPRADSGYKVLVAGLGPAGYTLAHHLLNDGHTVVGIDGLKIEPVPEALSGVTPLGQRVPFAPVKDIAELYEGLDKRTLAGFGGVAEYGITVRWDKNYLRIIRLLLERRAPFSMIGGVRFGSSLNYDNAFAMGFDHIALCMGAGSPTIIDMPNGLSRGVRTASDFLMSLQLSGAGKKDSIANLQLRLPVVVIGGGLTAIDTATESLAYYPVQVEKFLNRYETLVAQKGEAAVRAGWSEEDTQIAEEFLSHARIIRAEKVTATKAGREADIWSLLDEWGGVKLIYRKRLIDAPSYRLNHEEVEKALEEGIFFAELLEPKGIEVDLYGHAKAILLKKAQAGAHHEEVDIILPARTVLIAAGTNPNTVLQREDPTHFTLDGRYFQAVDEDGQPVRPARVAKPAVPQVLLSFDEQGRAVSFFGDLHPSFAGNVVKAMGSAKQGYPVVTRVLQRLTPSPVRGEGWGGGSPIVNKYNSHSSIPFARELRKNMPDAEKHLWQHLRAQRFEGYRFRRQHAIGEKYIVDFICLKKKLIIELDGGQHAQRQAYDDARTAFLEQEGYRVLRFWNNEVFGNLEGVLTVIAAALAEVGRTPSLTLPPSGGGDSFLAAVNSQLRATVHAVNRLTPTIVEVVIHAPSAAQMFQPGQFYRLQNFEAFALRTPATGHWPLATTLTMEGLAMTGAWVDRERGLVSVIALEMGGSSDLCAHLKPGEPVVLMGPTGTPTEIPERENVLLIGGGLGNAVLFSIGKAMREKGCRVLYFAGYKKAIDRYKVQDIEEASDCIVWCCDEHNFATDRPEDKIFHGNIVEAIRAYGEGRLGDTPIALPTITRIIAIGSDRMMAAVGAARHGVLHPHLNPQHIAIASVNSPMQCMMKEICAQCLQKHIDPLTGVERYVYSCTNQDQPLDAISFPHLRDRLMQNSVQEKLTAQWVDACLRELGLRA